MIVKPKPGMIVRDPKTHVRIPDSGKEVPANSYWTRRLRAGDVELANRKELKKSRKSDSESSE